MLISISVSDVRQAGTRSQHRCQNQPHFLCLGGRGGQVQQVDTHLISMRSLGSTGHQRLHEDTADRVPPRCASTSRLDTASKDTAWDPMHREGYRTPGQKQEGRTTQPPVSPTEQFPGAEPEQGCWGRARAGQEPPQSCSVPWRWQGPVCLHARVR